MEKRPLIGIIGKSEPMYEGEIWRHMTINDEFRYLTVKNGGTAMGVLPTQPTLKFNENDIHDDTALTEEELAELYRQMDFCDGFILQGGLYSCSYEIDAARRAIAGDKPVLGICAGFNNILRALGSGVVLDETGGHDHYDVDYRHDISIVPGTPLYDIVGQPRLAVNSIHSMIAPREMVEAVATVTATSDDGLVEGFVVPGKKFVMGVKWHPELMHTEAYVDRLFAAFVQSCK